MHAEVYGSDDAPPLVALHGGTGTGDFHWRHQIDALSEHMRLHVVDLPGHGSTPLDGDTYDREVLVDALAAYVDELDGPVHLCGFSMGGHTALPYVARNPEKVASLVVVGVAIREHEGLDGWRTGFDPDEMEENFPLWARKLSKLHEPQGGPDAWREVCRRDAKGLAVAVSLDDLAAFEGPALLIRGDRDPVAVPEQYAELRDVWPQAGEAVVPNGGHDVQMTRRELVRPLLRDFYADRRSS